MEPATTVRTVSEAFLVLESWHGCACLDKYRDVSRLRLVASALRASLALWNLAQGTTYKDQALAGLTVNLGLFKTMLKDSVVTPGVRPSKEITPQ